LAAGPSTAFSEPQTSKKPAAKKEFQASFFGEGGGRLPENSPDGRDFRENCSRLGVCGPQVPKPGPVEDDPNESDPEDRSAPVPDGWNPAADRPVIVEPRASAEARATAKPAQTVRAETPPPQVSPEESPVVGPDDGLRDAPAAMRPGNYSLWRGLSQPLMLPPDKIGGVTADRAKSLGSEDYDTHILGARSRRQAMPMLASEAKLSARTSDPEKGQFVVLELDIASTPGEFRDAVSELADAAGFEMDERFAPGFIGPDKTRVTVQGWLPPNRFGDAMSLDRVARLEAGGGQGRRRASGMGGWTELLLGIRAPAGGAPNAVLDATVGRLTAKLGFQFGRAIAYQRIPGTDRMVLVVSGRIRVRDIGRLMADPDVVKIGPSPRVLPAAPKAPPRSFKERLIAFVTVEHPILFLVTILLTISLIGAFLRRRERQLSIARGMAQGRSGRAPSSDDLFHKPQIAVRK